MTALFLIVLAVVVIGTALALAGRWRPQGLPDLPAAAPVVQDGRPPRFDVVLRGYRMDQVDAEIARLRSLVGEELVGEQEGEAPAAPRTAAEDEPAARPTATRPIETRPTED